MTEQRTFDPTPPRPDAWSPANEDYEQVEKIDYHGQPYKVWQKINRSKVNLSKAWADFRQSFRNQEPRPPGHGRFNPPLELIEFKELNREI